MLGIETISDGETTTFRLGRQIRSDDLDELWALLERTTKERVLDLRNVMLVDRNAVLFLGSCEAKGIELLNCRTYIREWILRENRRDVI
jgi:hypothetical protein